MTTFRNLEKITLLIIGFFLYSNCGTGPTEKSMAPAKAVFTEEVEKVKNIQPADPSGYSFKNPDQTWELPKKLHEISGLTITDKQEVACIQDEEGLLFIYDLNTNKIKSSNRFYRDADYEDVVLTDNYFFVLKSNGNLYKIERGNLSETGTTKIETILEKENDQEGICLSPDRKSLYIACKGIPLNGNPSEKHVYSFDLEKETVSPDPVLVLSLKNITLFLEKNGLEKDEDLSDFFNPKKENLLFQPSAIGVHPITGQFFITSSVGKYLIICESNGEIVHLKKLKKKVHPQPEGLAFYPNGDLLISNEGKKEIAKIHLFKYQNK